MRVRNFCFLIPEYLRDQIHRRATVRNASRNEEMRALILFALNHCGDTDIPLQLPEGPLVRIVVGLRAYEEGLIRDRARSYQRAAGKEVTRLLMFALDEIAQRDLAIISSMMRRQNQPAPPM